MKIAYIMRGIPGSGKSTWLREQGVPEENIASADHYHEDEHGVYRFNPAKIKFAHDQCLLEFFRLLRYGSEPHSGVDERGNPVEVKIAVDNTNVRQWELAPYVRMAEAMGYEARIVRMVCDPGTAMSRGVHQVPPDRVWQMYLGMQDLTGTPWTETPVFSSPVPVFTNPMTDEEYRTKIQALLNLPGRGKEVPGADPK